MANRIFVFCNLIRLFKPTGILLLYIPCAFGVLIASNSWFIRIYYLFIFFCGSCLMRSAGCIINDLWDRKIDEKVDRTKIRPLVTGQVNLKQAYSYLFVLLSLSLVLLFSLPTLAIKISLFSFIFVVIYPVMKRITFFPQIFLGITYNFGVVIGYVAVANYFNPLILIAYFGFIFWTITYDTIYAFLDIDDDKKIGVKSLAILLEKRNYKIYFYSFSLIFISLCSITEILLNPGYYIFLNALILLSMCFLIYFLNIKDKVSCMISFKIESVLGLFLIIALSLGQCS